jgi:ubiquinone/menaquinone biosynthesis C-methylase UbiE
MKEKTTANLEETGKYYDEHVFNELGFENPLFFKRMVVNLLLKYKSDLKNKKLIDIGCGNGNFLEYAEEFFETYGVDISKKAIEIANERCKKTKLSVSVAEKLKFSDILIGYQKSIHAILRFCAVRMKADECNRLIGDKNEDR